MSSNETFDTDIVDISEFFSSGSSSSLNEEETGSKSTFNEVDSPIKELKAIILSLDWEITDEIADSFITEVDRLLDVWKTDKSVVSFLQILRALGKYLRTHKADAHPESINLLYSVYNNFEKIVLTDEITEDQEQHILKEELEKFHKLKEKIALASSAASEGKANEHLLSALKSILQEIDWQITNQTMQKFDIEINKLEQIWSTDKNFLTPLQMMRAIGKYITKNKRDSHPDSIKLLSTVFQHFEEMALTEDMRPEEQQELIQSDLEKFSQLKSQILSVKTTPPAETELEKESDEIPSKQTEIDLPAQIHEAGDTSQDEDFGHVEPMSFDSDDTIPSPAGIFDSSDVTGETEEEVDSRLSDLFSENDQGFSTDMVDVVPLSGKEVDDSPIQTEGEVPPVPPGQISTDFSEDQEMEELTPLPVEPISDVSQGTCASDLEINSEKEFQGNLTATLLRIAGATENIDQLNTDILRDEIRTLQDLLQHPAQKILLQVLQSIVLYIEKTANLAHPNCFKIIRNSSHTLAETENRATDPNCDLLTTIEPILDQYIEFQNSVIFPAVSELASKEIEIKKILGIKA